MNDPLPGCVESAIKQRIDMLACRRTAVGQTCYIAVEKIAIHFSPEISCATKYRIAWHASVLVQLLAIY